MRSIYRLGQHYLARQSLHNVRGGRFWIHRVWLGFCGYDVRTSSHRRPSVEQKSADTIAKNPGGPRDADRRVAKPIFRLGGFRITAALAWSARVIFIIGVGQCGTRFAEAEKWYTAALTRKADDVGVRTDLDRANQEFTRSLAIDANHIRTRQNLTAAYTKKGDKAKASATLAKLESLEPTNRAITKLREDIQTIGGKQ